jgi:hypothetical protein
MTGEPGQPPGWSPPVAYAPDHPQATTSLVLGVAGVVLCGLAAPFAWATGRRTVREIDASQGRLGGRGAAQAGYVLGIVGTMILAIGVLVLVGMFVFFVVLAGLLVI